ncbi:hypothetical protein RJ641_018584 [Dillenia turbinata]|uniref:Uncharacterized protein n=1 Tax=Dillenia turbinata TaxID=194707 RepID=A0AAN8UXZ1_9MAGN
MVVVILIANAGGAKAIVICNMDSSELALCLPAISGPATLPPSVRGVKKSSGLAMLRGFGSYVLRFILSYEYIR